MASVTSLLSPRVWQQAAGRTAGLQCWCHTSVPGPEHSLSQACGKCNRSTAQELLLPSDAIQQIKTWEFQGRTLLSALGNLYLAFLLLHREPVVEQGLDPKIPPSR